MILVIAYFLSYFASALKVGLIGVIFLALWYVIISFIDGEWDIRSWYLYTRGWGRFVMLCIFALTFYNVAEEFK
jgi:hypothetical protein